MQFITLQNWEDLDLDEKLFQNVVGPPFGFFRPSKIQAFSLPLIMQEPYENLIAQAHNGSGKTVAFALGSLSHVDPYKDQLQVICVAHSRELIIQNFDVYKKISKNTGIRVNVMLSYKECPQIIGHVLIATPSTLEQQIRRNKVDVSKVKCLVIDEADLMFDVNSNNLGVTTKKLLERMKPPP